ncbi:class I SAM-dependent methyltransferase [Zobellella aerophila]|uniref:Methyltransferase type 11 domain-containing protein n=1 Tax=Zobellella aerophila TaxID=870480 RepID=A0ABP6VWW5_9GAMM
MTQHWRVHQNYLELGNMPFYWRMSQSSDPVAGIKPSLPARISINSEFDFLELMMSDDEWENLEKAYSKNENIGFINPESGQLDTYGNSVNQFFLKVANSVQPNKIYEIGCGAGFTINFLKQFGWNVTGIDPSDYSKKWSETLGFELLSTYFDDLTLNAEAELIICNDVFEHVRNVPEFSSQVYRALKPGGVFCFSTTNSTLSVQIGDISMLEHQHVNMFTEHSIFLILRNAGFNQIELNRGDYGNTFHVVARKVSTTHNNVTQKNFCCTGFFERAAHRLERFSKFYHKFGAQCAFYVPLRCIPYLASVGDFGDRPVFDSNIKWTGKYIDGYKRPISGPADIDSNSCPHFFIGSMTFEKQITEMLISRDIDPNNIHRIREI